MFYIERYKVKKILLPFILIMICYGCNDSSAPNVDLFDTFVGTWKLEDDTQYERWTKNDDGSYISTGFSVNGKDTIISERVKIYKSGDGWNFETLVIGQNEGKSVIFTSTILNDTLVQFENREHDFPNLVNYRLLFQNSLRAFIAGKNDTIYFNYSRVRL